MRVLLTSAGLNNQNITEFFHESFGIVREDTKALFIVTAAISPGAIQVLPSCLNDLLKVGIKEENIRVYDMHKTMTCGEIQKYDLVYICGGYSDYLLDRINEDNFRDTLQRYISLDGYVIGVSAGSIVMTSNLDNNLGLAQCILKVHCCERQLVGRQKLNLNSDEKVICLTDEQAIYLSEKNQGMLIE